MAENYPLNLFPALEEADIRAIEQAIQLMGAIPQCVFEQWKNKSELEESIAVDPSGLTSALIIAAHVDNYLQDASFSLSDILAGKHLASLATPNKIVELLNSPGIVKGKQEFKNSLLIATKQIGIEETEESLNNPYTLAFLRLNALTTFKGMRRDQFVTGNSELRTPFQLNTWIYEFININSMIAAAARQAMDGVTLTLIRDPEIPEHSYFGFLIRYGENIIFLSDRPKFDNPAQSSWTRNPGRDLQRRMNRSLFPYSVLDIQYDARDRAYVKPTQGLVLHQETAFQVAKLSNICKDEAIWAVLLTDLIHSFICKNAWKQEKLTYTAEMVVNPQALQDKGVIVPSGYSQLEVQPITKNEVTHQAVSNTFRVKSSGCRSWLEDLYGDQVSESILRIDTGNLLMLGNTSAKEDSYLALKTQKLTNFGTEQELQKSRIWLARWNYTRQIIVEAQKDYKVKVDEVKEWYLGKLLARLPVLVDAIVKGQYLAPYENMQSGFKMGPLDVVQTNILQKLEESDTIGRSTPITSGYSRQFDEFYGINNELGTQRFRFKINNPTAIAQICGCELHELPIYLQHYHEYEPERGNWMLDDVDPMDAFHNINPWDDFPAKVTVFVSNTILQKYKKTPFPLFISKPDQEFLANLEETKKAFGTIVEKKTAKSFRIKSYYPSSDSIQLRTKWRKNMQVNSFDIFHNFEIQNKKE